MRGNRHAAGAGEGEQGSIPACAGKPRRRARRGSPPRVHPRVCGETDPVQVSPHAESGPSPRVRGNPPARHALANRGGSIPACAGKPAGWSILICIGGVHPRVCGETAPRRLRRPLGSGPSPRVRGNRRRRLAVAEEGGSIPACAGKPPATRRGRASVWVHPRVCGETRRGWLRGSDRRGPSPRVRGNRTRALRRV